MKLLKNQLTVVWHLKDIGKVRTLDTLNENKKNSRLDVQSIFLIQNKGKYFLYWLITYDEKRILYDVLLNG